MSAYESRALAAPLAGARRPPKSTAPGSWRILIPLYLGLAVGSAALYGVLRPGAWWALTLLVSGLILGSAAAVRGLGGPRILGSIVGAGVGLVLMTLIFGPSTAFLGLVPTLNTLTLFRQVVQQGAQQVYTQAAPAVPVPEIVFLVVGGMAVVAVLQDLLAFVLRVPALCGVVLLTLVAIPGGVVYGEFDIVAFIVLAGLYLWMLRADVRVRELAELDPAPGRNGTAAFEGGTALTAVGLRGAALAAGAVVLSLVLPNVIPAFTETGFTGAGPGGGGATSSGRVNPILDLGDDLRQPGNIDALSYTTDSEEPLYFKLTTLSRFTGRTWAPSRTTIDDSNTVDAIATAPGRNDRFPATEVEVDVRVQGSNTRWLPAPYSPARVDGLEGDWHWEPDGLTISTDNSSTRGQDYRVISSLAAPTREQLSATVTTPTPYLQRNLELPDGLPELISRTAEEVTSAASNDYERAVALQDYFRSGDFRYSEQAPVESGYDGNGMEVIARFLEERAGYCVHFSSSMAVMARSLGIPARIAIGYLPGSRDGTDDGRAVYQVGTQDLHAWPELYFEGAGWLKFEPTPGRGDVPEYASPAPAETTSPTSTEDAATPAPAATTPTTNPDESDSQDEAAASTASTSHPAFGFGIAALGIALLAAPAIIRSVRRARRRAALHAGRAAASVAWEEVQDTVRDLGIAVQATETPRAFAERIATLPGMRPPVRDAVEGVCAAVERERFASAEASDAVPAEHGARLVDWATTITTGLSARASWQARARATLAPASLLAGGRPARPPRLRSRRAT